MSQIDFQNQRRNGSSDDENEEETECDAPKNVLRRYPAYLILAKQLLKVYSKHKEDTYGGFYLQKCYQNELELEYLFQVCPLFKHFSFLKTTRSE